MEIFRHRNLALGCASFLVCLAISFYLNSIVRIVALAIFVLLALTLTIVYLMKKRKSVLDLIIKYAPLLFFSILAMALSLIWFNKTDDIKILYNGEEHEIVATVEKIEYERPYKTRCIVNIDSVDLKRKSFKMLMEVESGELDVGDQIRAVATIEPLKSTTIGYNERGAYLDNGIISIAVASGCQIIKRGNYNLNLFEKLNYKLSDIFEDNMKSDSSALYSAVVLGNRANLSDTIRRDAARVGVSHALALSGMHITIIATLLGLLLRLLPIPRIPKILILIFGALFFVLLTGMSEPAVRAAIMMSLFYIFKIAGKRNDSITALFLSVTVICIVNPFMIFSVSLMLSFFALLGCFIATMFARKIKLGRVRIKPFRFILYSLLTTAFVMLFTLPIITRVFGTFSILTPLSNMILVPIFTLLIYLGAVMLIFSGFSGLSDLLFHLGDNLSDFILNVIEKLANISGILIPIYSVLQIIGVGLIAIALVLLIVSRKKQFKILTGVLGFSVLFFSFACAYNYIDKASNTYVSTYNYGTNDFVAVETKNQLTLIDVSEATTGVCFCAGDFSLDCNATEIENYIMTDYSGKANLYFEGASSNIKINNLYLVEPNEDEREVYNKIIEIAEKDGISVFPLKSTLSLDGCTFDFSPTCSLERSKKRSVAFNISVGEIDVLYLGASSYEIFDYFTRSHAYKADAVIFGAHGPNYKKAYSYEMPNVDKMIFYGDARGYADELMIEENEKKIIENKGLPIKLKLKRKK